MSTVNIDALRAALKSVDAIGDLTEGHFYIVRAPRLTAAGAQRLHAEFKAKGIDVVIVALPDFDVFEVHP